MVSRKSSLLARLGSSATLFPDRQHKIPKKPSPPTLPPFIHRAVGFFEKLFRQKTSAAAPSSDDKTEKADDMLVAPRQLLASGQKDAALAAYEKIATAESISPETLASISADLGQAGHLSELVALVAPVYDPATHGAATGLNLLQAYLQLRNAPAADLLLEVLFALQKPEIHERLLGFQNALEELRASGDTNDGSHVARPNTQKAVEIKLATISRPIWSYRAPGGEGLLPTKSAQAVCIALMPFGVARADKTPVAVGHPMQQAAVALPLAFAEASWMSPRYRPIAAEGIDENGKLFVPRAVLPASQLMRLFGAGENAARYAVSGSILIGASDAEIQIKSHIWDLKRGREMRVFASTGPDALHTVFNLTLTYLEVIPLGANPLRYSVPENFQTHLACLTFLLRLFFVEKKVAPETTLTDTTERFAEIAAYLQTNQTALLPRLILQAAIAHADELKIEITPALRLFAENTRTHLS